MAGKLVGLMAAALVVTAGAAAQAEPIAFRTALTGAAENPAVVTTGSGAALVVIDPEADTLRVRITFDDLQGTTVAAHIHCCAPPPDNVGVATTVPTFPGFPVGVTSGIYDVTFATTAPGTYSPTFLTANGGTVEGAEAALLAGLLAGRAYVNVHTTFAPAGEIRGFLAQVPEPGGLGAVGVGLVMLGVMVGRRRMSARLGLPENAARPSITLC